MKAGTGVLLVVGAALAFPSSGLAQEQTGEADALDFLMEEEPANSRQGEASTTGNDGAGGSGSSGGSAQAGAAGDGAASATPTEAAPAEATPAATQTADNATAPAADTGATAPVPTIDVPERADTAATTATPAKRRRGVIEEVVVTAQRREESAQDVPISITVLDAKQIANANITNASDLAIYTPSLSTNQRFGSDNATFALRGFTQELRTTPSVGTYFAEVIAPRGQSSQSSGDGAGPGALFDLQNVQVLKGPQGTLFGRNTTGGAVLLVPNKPTEELEGYFEFSTGNWNMLRKQAVVNVPFTETFKTRLSVDMNQREGYMRNVHENGPRRLADTDYFSGRFSTLWSITDAIDNYTIFTYIDSNSNGHTSRLFDCNPNPFNFPMSVLTGPGCREQLARQRANGQDGFYDLISTIKSSMTDIEEKRVINTLTWDVSENFTVKNILAYAHLHTENGSDIFGTDFQAPYDPDPRREFDIGISVPNPDIPVTSQETYVAELQALGQSFEGALEWQGGIYYENSRPDGFSGNNSAGLISCEPATIEGDPSQFNCFDPTGGQLGSVLVQHYKTEYLNRAVYSQLSYNISQKWRLTGGLRYTLDRSEGYGIKTRYRFIGSVQAPPTTQVTTPRVSSRAPTGVIELSYKPVEDVMAYAKYLRGYRQGSVILAADPGVDTFDPEKVHTYEIGAKTSFGGPIPGRLNFAVFYNDFTNQQLQFGYISPSAGPTTTIANAGSSRIQGMEVEGFFQLAERLTLGLSASYLDTELLEQEDYRARVQQAGGPVAGATSTPIADVGDELPYAPKYSYVASLSWHVPVSETLGDVDAGITYSYVGEQRAAASSATPYGMLPDFNLLNLNLSWTRILRSPVDLTMFATNVLEEKYMTYVAGTYNVLGFEARMVGQPRMFGARLKYNFGGSDS